MNTKPYAVSEDNPSGADVQKAVAALPKLSTASYSISPKIKPVCQKATWSAPKHQSTGGDPSVEDAIQKFCKWADGKKIKKQPHGVDTSFNMFPQSYYSFWLSAQNWYNAPAEYKCADEVTITKDECTKYLTHAMNACDEGDDTHGAAFAELCIYYVRRSDTTPRASLHMTDNFESEHYNGLWARCQ